MIRLHRLLPSGRARLPAAAGAGLILALGRFDWSGDTALAWRCWALSAFFFLAILLAVDLTLGALRPEGRSIRGIAAGLLAVGLNLPHRWLGLDRFFYLDSHPLSYGYEKEFAPEWLGRGGGFHWSDPACVLLLIAAAALVLSWAGLTAYLASRGRSRPAVLHFFLLLALLVTIETWLHLSNRSPYTYLTHFEQPPPSTYVYASEMLPRGHGAVNSDFGYFVTLEALFTGSAPSPSMLLVRRAFPFYLSHHFSLFLGPYLAFLWLNPLFWIGAVAATYYFCRDLSGSGRAAGGAAVLVACGPGFVVYAAQPMGYLAGFAFLAVSLYLYHRIVVVTQLASPGAIVAAGTIVGLEFLTYDSFAWAIFFVGYALLRRVPPARAAAPLIGGVAWYGAFLLLIFGVFKFAPEHLNDQYIGQALRQSWAVWRHPYGPAFWSQVGAYFSRYWRQLLQVNFYLPVILAAAGWALAPRGRNLRAVAALLLLPSAVNFAFLHFGGSYLASYSRFNYPAFPALVLLASLAMARVADWARERGHPALGWSAMALPLAGCLLWSNLDAWGVAPWYYFHFYFTNGGFFPR